MHQPETAPETLHTYTDSMFSRAGVEYVDFNDPEDVHACRYRELDFIAENVRYVLRQSIYDGETTDTTWEVYEKSEMTKAFATVSGMDQRDPEFAPVMINVRDDSQQPLNLGELKLGMHDIVTRAIDTHMADTKVLLDSIQSEASEFFDRYRREYSAMSIDDAFEAEGENGERILMIAYDSDGELFFDVVISQDGKTDIYSVDVCEGKFMVDLSTKAGNDLVAKDRPVSHNLNELYAFRKYLRELISKQPY